MAKRKRLTPAQPGFLSQPVEPVGPTGAPPIAQVAGDASAVSALQELSEMVEEAREKGLFLQNVSLDDIDEGHLVRDRMAAEEDDLVALMESLRARGQQTPVDLVDLGPSAKPRYGLISGWRRVHALRRLQAEGGAVNAALAQIRQPDSSAEAYVAMVEENEIRVGLSYYERARIVVKALDEGVFTDTKQALQSLYGNVSRAKRSKIKSFMALVSALDDSLQFPTRIGERLGLEMSYALASAEGAERLRMALEAKFDSAEDEQTALLRALRRVSSTRARPTPSPSVPSPAMYFDAEAHAITLSGDGVDEALFRALERWLAKRQG